MFRFEDPQYLFGLVLVPIFCLFYVIMLKQKRKALKKFSDVILWNALMPEKASWKECFKFALQMIGLSLLIIAFARPQIGVGMSSTKRSGSEIIIALDISNSMLAEDIAPNRLAYAKQFITGLIDKMGDDKVGLIVFAGDAFSQMPITNDYISAKMFLDAISPSIMTTQGTDIAKAISLAEKSFTQSKDVGKSILIITDGENHEGGAEAAAQEAFRKGFKLIICGIGRSTGAPIPDENHRGSYLKDNKGDIVITHFNESMCKTLASYGKGTYIYLDNISVAHQRVISELDRMQKGESTILRYDVYEELFQWIVLLAFLVLGLDALLLNKKSKRFQKINLFKRNEA